MMPTHWLPRITVLFGLKDEQADLSKYLASVASAERPILRDSQSQERTNEDSDFIPCRDCSVPGEFDSFDQLYDVYYPTGTPRMGSCPSARVVDADLRLWACGHCC